MRDGAMKQFTRGQLAALSGVKLETIRYYEKRGILPVPARSRSNYRLYSEDSAKRLQFIKRAQQLGFTLEEIKELFDLRATRGAGCSDVRRRAMAKIADIESKISSLQAIHAALGKLVNQCSGRGPLSKCPILDAMEGEGTT
jgi:MerR family mercuric resistance operon transcriptional regulator